MSMGLGAQRVAITVALGLLAGCGGNQPMPQRVNNFEPVMPQAQITEKVVDGSIYSSRVNGGLFGDRKAYQAGDLITILLRERTNAVKEASGSVERSSSNDALSPLQLARFGSAGGLFSSDSTMGSSISNDGTGAATQSNQLGGDITVSVVSLLPNGNLVIRGEKLITLNHGDEYVRVSGVIRPDDIQPDNTILSKRIANAQITYSGSGQLNDATKLAWGNAFFLKFWPF
jgi:flagellar L-ring protein precursor FlgH